MNKVVLLCRPGFEKECAAEITDKAGKREIFGFARVKENAGYVIYECYQPEDGEKLISELPFSSLIFARQWFVVGNCCNIYRRKTELRRLSACCRA
ncbi:LSU rRNA 2'-O-methyl-C2498 methyl transferase RlmM [Salmonella enterica subsp. enterica]|uniref:LSU rRNA 2'-O-methyl-C2498 methyl transferase RlmM n=1 Tax=Salmonella enterica I TaxID=59201 RepID=A0A379W3K6_SALET|nr:LSU rRNA 2'-O-methyl-C2498 methyl transferase RlmM [Salmonella enterica subsp. enterica]